MQIIQLSKLEESAKEFRKKNGIKVRRLLRRPSTKKVEIGVFILILLIFGIKTTNYFHSNLLKPQHIYQNIKTSYRSGLLVFDDLKYFRRCPAPLTKIEIGQRYICREKIHPSIYQKIYDTYPLHGKGREIIYSSLDAGDIQRAKDFVNNKVDISRNSPLVLINDPIWNEDPYNDRYWRLNYYSLRPVLDMLYADRITKDKIYQEKIIKTVDSFITTGVNQPNSWDDTHAVAFRTMALTNIWWKMREQRVLSITESNKLLISLKQHGDFLLDRNHYEPGHNHGTNEAAALYLLAVSFPDLPGASNWLSTARDRINNSLNSLIDSDGALIENSPYYHFYTLEKYWDIYNYSLKQQQQLSPTFANKLNQMISYATYILQPDGSVPLLGASLRTTINKHAEYSEMAAKDQQFLYVLTQGKMGNKPKDLNKVYLDTGQSIMRSGWSKGDDFKNQTQIIFDVGAYRTNHSDLDALSFSLFANGTALLPDSGLYTYTPGPYRDYFHGTAAHNTVVVDNTDQAEGSVAIGYSITKNGYSLQTAQHQLYEGVTHMRSLIMIDKKHTLIIDKLTSDKPHNYKQMFHLFPGAKLVKNGLTVSGLGKNPDTSITIRQLKSGGVSESDTVNQTTPPSGVCSQEYGKLIPCESVSYSQNGKDGYFVTLLTSGREDSKFNASLSTDQTNAIVNTNNKHYEFKIGVTQYKDEATKATNPKAPDFIRNTVLGVDNINNWSANGGTLTKDSTTGAISLNSSNTSSNTAMENNNIQFDLSHANLALRLRVSNVGSIKKLYFSLSNNHWNTTATNVLNNAYKIENDGEWLNISLGKDQKRNGNGQWSTSGNFDWSKIDGIRFSTEASKNISYLVQLGPLYSTAEQRNGSVIIIFNDGFDSILPAAEYLKKQNLKANVAVITKYIQVPIKGRLALIDLKRLQNDYGWNIVNHSQEHVDAVQVYSKTSKLELYSKDILSAANFLAKQDINSAPNWFIYPYGKTNDSLKAIISKYYKFAISTNNEPETFPFGDPYAVKSFSVRDASGDTEDPENQSTATTPEDVAAAINDAKNYKTTLILTFHRIHSTLSDSPGYEINDFKKIIDNLKEQNIQVLTLSEFDKQNSIPADNVINFGKNNRVQLSIQVKVTTNNIIKRLTGIF